MKYDVEKVLYLADQDKGLNVSLDEKEGTDLDNRVKALLSAKMIELVASDDSDNYYKITKKGKIKLLKMQIEYRSKHGKAIDLHQLELEELENA
ncbi:hypothetical protein [Shewanella algae]|uniref:hypothetical protein n=1 Tax=Shewanella algae TaxID=38313 RepID=UPI00313A7A42